MRRHRTSVRSSRLTAIQLAGLAAAAVLLGGACTGAATLAPAPSTAPAGTATSAPTPAPTAVATPEPTPPPTPEPTPAPTAAPTPEPTPAPTAAPTPEPTAAPVVLSSETYAWSDAATGREATFIYPRLEGGESAATDAINADLTATVEKMVEDWRSGLDPEPAFPDQPDGLEGETSVALQSDTTLSLRLQMVTMFSGAAHPGTTLVTRTYDLASGTAYDLADLFKPGADYLGRLSKLSRTALRAQLDDDSGINAGTGASATDYAGWALVPDGLEITFAQYQVAAYAYGMPVVVIPAASFGSIVDPSGPLAALP